MLYLADTNVLLRFTRDDAIEYSFARNAVRILRRRNIGMAYTMQNIAEFWNVSTRPQTRNGFGLSLAETEENAKKIESSLTFLPDTEKVYQEWRRIVVEHRISGVQVHDARLAAVMYAYRLTNILTANTADFARFPGLIAVNPINIASDAG